MISTNNAGKELTLELVIDAAAPSQHLITVADLARTYTQGRLMVVTTKSEELSPNTSTSSAALTAPAPHSPAQDESGSNTTEPAPTPAPAPAIPATEAQ